MDSYIDEDWKWLHVWCILFSKDAIFLSHRLLCVYYDSNACLRRETSTAVLSAVTLWKSKLQQTCEPRSDCFPLSYLCRVQTGCMQYEKDPCCQQKQQQMTSRIFLWTVNRIMHFRLFIRIICNSISVLPPTSHEFCHMFSLLVMFLEPIPQTI